MLTFIIYIWILDLFLYSNTELFLIFFIYFNFGILIFNFIIWFSEYADEYVLVEIRNVYVSILKLRTQFDRLRDSTHSLCTYSAGEDFISRRSVNFFSSSFSAIIVVLDLMWRRYNSFKQYIKLNAYLFNLLVQFYKFELLNFEKFISLEFLKLADCPANSQNRVIVDYSNNRINYLFSDILFNFFVNFYMSTYNCENDYSFYWTIYLPFIEFIKICLIKKI